MDLLLPELDGMEVIEAPMLPPENENAMLRRFVEIIEQPAPLFRFRYATEGRRVGPLLGVSSNPTNKTYPAIKIHGYVGHATIIVSCVTTQGLFVHPYNLAGRNCDRGMYCVRVGITDDAREVHLKDIGIQRVKRREIREYLAYREERRIDPFNRGFAHVNDLSLIDLNAVRLAIQVIVRDEEGRYYTLDSICTDTIHDRLR